MKYRNPAPGSSGCDVAAAAKVFGDYGDFIKKVIRSQVQDEDQAEDLFQNFFLSLVSKPFPEDIQNMEGYLYKAIINEIADTNRLIKNYQNLIREYAERNNHPRSQETPEKVVMKIDEANRVFEIIEKRLPRTEAQASYLQYRDDLSTEKIAEIMDVRRVTVRGYIHEGLKRIRRILQDCAARKSE